MLDQPLYLTFSSSALFQTLPLKGKVANDITSTGIAKPARAIMAKGEYNGSPILTRRREPNIGFYRLTSKFNLT